MSYAAELSFLPLIKCAPGFPPLLFDDGRGTSFLLGRRRRRLLTMLVLLASFHLIVDVMGCMGRIVSIGCCSVPPSIVKVGVKTVKGAYKSSKYVPMHV